MVYTREGSVMKVRPLIVVSDFVFVLILSFSVLLLLVFFFFRGLGTFAYMRSNRHAYKQI